MLHILILLSLIFILFGVLVILEPQIISYLIGIFFILTGLIGAASAFQFKDFMNRFKK